MLNIDFISGVIILKFNIFSGLVQIILQINIRYIYFVPYTKTTKLALTFNLVNLFLVSLHNNKFDRYGFVGQTFHI